MLFTSLWFWSLRKEVESRIQEGRITGGRAFPAGLRLSLDTGSGPVDLLLWLDPAYPRAECLRAQEPAELPGAWRILHGATCTSVFQPDCDRRLELRFEAGERSLVVDYRAFRRPAVSLREVAGGEDLAVTGPGDPGGAPPPKPFLLERLEWVPDGVGTVADLGRRVRGLDRYLLAAAAAEVDLSAVDTEADPERIQRAWHFLVERTRQVETGRTKPCVVYESGLPSGVSLLDLSSWLPHLQFEPMPTLSDASHQFVYLRRKLDEIESKRRRHMVRARDQRARLQKRLGQLEADRRRQQDHPLLRENADWLMARLHEVKQGDPELVVPGVQGERRVRLDPTLKPHEQAERWYKDARRMQRGLAATEERIALNRSELEQLDELLARVEGHLADTAEPYADAWRLLAAAVARAPVRQSVRVSAPPPRFRRFRSPGGLAIWVGRNNQENDELTLHQAHKQDLWFHAQQTPGSHVVLRCHMLNQKPAAADIVAAAATAAYYSRARTSSKVPVIYTEAKYVRKPRKAPAGTVIVEREKSIMVEPKQLPPWESDDDS